MRCPRWSGSFRWLGAALLALAFARPALAQQGACASRFPVTTGPVGEARNVCQAGVDAATYLHPVVGLLLGGGAPVLGSAAPLGGLGHVSITLPRATMTRVVVPALNYDGSSNVVPANDTIPLPIPQVEAAIGLYGGLPSGALAVDGLLSAVAVPTGDLIDGLRVDSNATRIGDLAFGFGFGARVGVLPERRLLPAVSVSVMRRSIPRLGYGDVSAAGGDDFAFDADLKTTNFRLTAGKSLSLLTLVAGVGLDKSSGTATIRYRNPITGLADPTPITLDLSDSRTLVFLDAGLKLGPVTLVGEIGHQSGKDQKLQTDFQGVDETAGRTFYGAGLRVGF